MGMDTGASIRFTFVVLVLENKRQKLLLFSQLHCSVVIFCVQDLFLPRVHVFSLLSSGVETFIVIIMVCCLQF